MFTMIAAKKSRSPRPDWNAALKGINDRLFEKWALSKAKIVIGGKVMTATLASRSGDDGYLRDF